MPSCHVLQSAVHLSDRPRSRGSRPASWMKSVPPREIPRTWLSEKKTVHARIGRYFYDDKDMSRQQNLVWPISFYVAWLMFVTQLCCQPKQKLNLCESGQFRTRSIFCHGRFTLSMFCDCRFTCSDHAEEGGNQDPHLVKAEPHLDGDHIPNKSQCHRLAINTTFGSIFPGTQSQWFMFANGFQTLLTLSCWVLVGLKLLGSTSRNNIRGQVHCNIHCEIYLTLTTLSLKCVGFQVQDRGENTNWLYGEQQFRSAHPPTCDWRTDGTPCTPHLYPPPAAQCSLRQVGRFLPICPHSLLTLSWSSGSSGLQQYIGVSVILHTALANEK